MNELIKGAEAISLFCRLNINTKRELPIRFSEMGLLICLVQEPGEHTPAQIAKYFKVSKPMVTGMVTSLLKKDYLAKALSTIDKRSYILKPTAKGVALVNDTLDEYFKNMQVLRTHLGSTEYTNLIKLLEKANAILLEEKTNG